MPRLIWLGALLSSVGVLPIDVARAFAQSDTQIEVITEPPPRGEPLPTELPTTEPPGETPITEPPGETPTTEPPAEQPPPKPEPPKPKLGHLRVGAGIGFGFSSGFLSIGLAPQVSYIFKRIVEPGVSLRYQYTRDRITVPEVTWHTYGGSLFVRIFPVRQLFFLVEGEIINTGRKIGGTPTGRETFGNLLLGGGLIMGVGKGAFVATSLKIAVFRNPFYPDAFPIISVGGGYQF